MIEINNLIKEALKAKNKEELKAYRNLKTEFINFETAPKAKPLDETVQFSIIKKMVQKLINSEITYSEAHRQDLYDECRVEREILEKLLPKAASPQEIEDFLVTTEFMKESENKLIIEKKDMGKVIGFLKSKFPSTNGEIIANIVKSYII